MKEILGKAKTIRELLGGAKYSIDYYQREYRWQTKQIAELVNDLTSKFLESYEVEHIWANLPERHMNEFSHPSDFAAMRHRIGGLLLLPKSFNASYGALPYEEKLPHYHSQNLLARSLHPTCYQNIPGFLNFIANTGLPFRPMETFRTAEMEERCNLCLKLAEHIWNPELLRLNCAQTVSCLSFSHYN